MLPKWTEQVRISPERGLEGPHDDVFSWRKYGQKDILGAKYPRYHHHLTTSFMLYIHQHHVMKLIRYSAVFVLQELLQMYIS